MRSDDPLERNRRSWNATSDEYQRLHGRALADPAAAWGVWRVSEQELAILGEVAGRDVLELGCGAAQWSIELAQRGARVVGLDLSERQLAHAHRLVREAGVEVTLVQADAERAPFGERSFDLVFCDHGAMSFARPEPAVAEVSRLLRRGGRFAFCSSSPLVDVCRHPRSKRVTPTLHANYFELDRIEDEGAIYHQLPYGTWIRLFRRHDLIVEDLIEIRPPADAVTSFSDFVPLEWARRWPAEQIWKLSKA